MKPHHVLSRLVVPVLLLVGVCFFPASWTFAQGSPDPGASDLKQLCEKLSAASAAGDATQAAAITRKLLPDASRIAQALSGTVPAGVKEKVLAFHAKLPKTDTALAGLIVIKPGQTAVLVHASSVEDLAAYAPGSAAFAHFPGGAKTLAQNGVLRPGLVFYTVEFLEPGKDEGMKYHLFYWDGGSWSMLGPIWRAVQ